MRFSPLNSALVGEMAGFPDGVRFNDVLAVQTINEIRLLTAGIAGDRNPRLIDLLHEVKPVDIEHTRKYQRLDIKDLNKKIGWT